MQELDKVVHSAIGLGYYLAMFIVAFFSIKIAIYVLFGLLIIAILKEVKDYFAYGKFDPKDLLATLNPTIVIRWYLKIIKE